MEDIQFKKNYSAIIDPGYAAQVSKQKPQAQKTDDNGDTFAQVLQNNLQKGKLTFSKHALERIDARQIKVSPQLLTQMSNAVEKAKGKGVKDALILNGSTAFIVNVPSGTVVTTMNGGEMKENIFTNIDGAVII